MNSWSIGIAVILVPFLLNSLRRNSFHASESHGHVRMPSVFCIVGICSWCIAAAALLASMFLGSNQYLGIVAFAAIVIAALCTIIYKSIFIAYNEYGFWVRKFWRKEEFHNYDEIKGVIPGVNGSSTLLLQHGKIHLDGLAVGNQSFYGYAEERYCSVSGEFCIPDYPSTLFRGNVLDPGSIVVPVVMAWVFVLSGAIWSTFEAIRDYSMRTTDLRYIDVHINSVDFEDGEYFLNTSDTRFQITADVFESANTGELVGNTVTVGYDPRYGDGTDKPYSIWAVQDMGGKQLISFEANKQHVNKAVTKGLLIVYGVFGALTAFCGFGYYVLCYPERHPIIANMLIKKEYRNW